LLLGEKIKKQMDRIAPEEHSLEILVATFLSDLAHTNHSLQTCRAYTMDLAQLCAFYQGSVQAITADVFRNFFSMHRHLRPATRARKQAAMARFLSWAEQHEFIEVNPMRRIDRVKLEPPMPRGMERDQVERILTVIPADCSRDHLFFRLLLKERF
jgi:integrase/recombinase XerD